jgi:hypothetical protein
MVSPGVKMGQSSWITILLSVSVPVLSEQSMSIPAISSIAHSLETIAPWLERKREPKASVVVVTISMATGIEATSSTTAKLSASCGRVCERRQMEIAPIEATDQTIEAKEGQKSARSRRCSLQNASVWSDEWR